jgi:ribosome recycling factor
VKKSLLICLFLPRIVEENKDGLSDDELKTSEGTIQNLTDKFIAQADSIFELKEKDILTV